jgi:hypothetical protein
VNNLAKKVKNSGTGKMMHGTEKVVHTVESQSLKLDPWSHYKHARTFVHNARD